MTLKQFTYIATATAALAAPFAASASLVYDAAIQASAQGFGNAPRAITLQATGQDTFESGAVDYFGNGAIGFGTPVASGSVHDSNGVTNATGTTSLPNPLANNQKYGVPTIGSLGITTASQIAILFNVTEPGGNSINVLDVTLKFCNFDGTFLGAIDGQENFASSNPGNGVAGFTFTVSSDERAYVNGLLAQGGSGTTLALEASLGGLPPGLVDQVG